ncbi:MAG TPA: FHA domain-containing protein, partial [Candidatus Dormibacteraeota bacterium]|nr:FHA domain-containing protein [Candidatus Dormibacteraeota bacterium]
DELKAIVEAQGRAIPPMAPGPSARAPSRPMPSQARPQASVTAPRGAGMTQGARLVALDRVEPVPAEYSLMKDEISIGRGEENDVVIPHASVSRQHARLMRRDGGFELMDLNSTNGSYVDDRQIRGSAFLTAGTQVRLGDIRFVLQL